MRFVPLICDDGDRAREMLVAVDVIESAGDILPLRAGAAVFDLATGGRADGGRIFPVIISHKCEADMMLLKMGLGVYSWKLQRLIYSCKVLF